MAREDILTEPIPEDLEGLRTYVSQLRADFDSHNHDGANSRSFQTMRAETFTSRAFAMRKKSFTDTTAGIWMGLVGAVVKFCLGNANNYLKWSGTGLTLSGTFDTVDSSGNSRLQFFLSGGAGVFGLVKADSTVAVQMSESTFTLASFVEFIPNGTIGSGLRPTTTNTYDIGENSTPLRWKTIYLVNTPDVSSDKRHKTDIKKLKHGLETILKLKPVSFRRKKDTTKRVHLGFIAQEVVSHVPEAVSRSDEGEYGMSYEMLVPVLVKAVQELSAEVDRLKAR